MAEKSTPTKRPNGQELTGFISNLSPKKKCYYFDVQNGPDTFTKVQGFGLDSTYQKVRDAEKLGSPVKLTVTERPNYRHPVFNDQSRFDDADPVKEVFLTYFYIFIKAG